MLSQSIWLGKLQSRWSICDPPVSRFSSRITCCLRCQKCFKGTSKLRKTLFVGFRYGGKIEEAVPCWMKREGGSGNGLKS